MPAIALIVGGVSFLIWLSVLITHYGLGDGGTVALLVDEATAGHLDRIASLTTLVGAVYLVVLLLIPEAVTAGSVALLDKIGGGSALIMVCTILDLKKQVGDLSRAKPGGT